MTMTLALCILIIIPAIILIIHGKRDRIALTCAIIAAVGAGLMGLEPSVKVIDDLISPTLGKVLVIGTVTCGIISAVRLREHVAGAVLGTAGLLWVASILRIIS